MDLPVTGVRCSSCLDLSASLPICWPLFRQPPAGGPIIRRTAHSPNHPTAESFTQQRSAFFNKLD